MDLASVNVRFGADVTGFNSGVGAMRSTVNAFKGDALLAFAMVGVAIAGLAVKLGVDAVKAAADFQQGLNRLVTGAGDTTDNMKAMGDAILGISRDTGVLTDQLLPAMYQIISAGQRGAQAQDTLRVAAEGAIVEQAKIVDVAKAITTAMTDYVHMHLTATQAMNGYTRAVQLGKLTLEQLSVAMSPLLPIATNLGIKFSDVAAAMATMTNAGLPAERAATSLRFLFQSLENPTKKASTAMKEWGLNSVALANEMRVSLPGALQMVYDAAKKAGPEGSVPFNRAVSDMIGGQRSLQAFLSLTGTHLKTFKDDTAAIAAAMGIGKTAVLGWDVAQQNFNVQLDKAKAAFQGLLITIGSQLLPILSQLLQNIAPIITQFANWITSGDNLHNSMKQVSDILAPLGSAISDIAAQVGPMVQQFAAWAKQNDLAGKAAAVAKIAIMLLADALRTIVPMVVAVTIAVIEFIGTLIDRLQPAITAVGSHWQGLAAIIGGVWSTITGIIQLAWSIISGIILVGIDILSGRWDKAGQDMQNAWNGAWEGIKKIIIGGVKTVLGVFALLPGGIGDAARKALKQLDQLTGGVHNAAENIKKSAIQMQQAVVSSAQAMVNQLTVQLDNATSSSQRHFLQMKLDAAKQTLAEQQQVLANMTNMKNGVVSATTGMANQSSAQAQRMRQQVINHLKAMNDEAVGHSIIPNMVNSIISWFAKLPGGVMNAISSLQGRLAGFFNGLAAQAFSWGLHIILNIANGILAGIGAAIAAAQRVASAVAGILAHSKPSIGPLKDDDIWGAHLIDNFVRGILSGAPRVQAALASLFGGSGSIGIAHSFSGPQGIPVAFGGSGTPIIHNHITVMPPDMYLDGRLVTRQMGPYIADELWGQSGKRRPV